MRYHFICVILHQIGTAYWLVYNIPRLWNLTAHSGFTKVWRPDLLFYNYTCLSIHVTEEPYRILQSGDAIAQETAITNDKILVTDNLETVCESVSVFIKHKLNNFRTKSNHKVEEDQNEGISLTIFWTFWLLLFLEKPLI